MPRWLTLPNLVTLTRLAATPFVARAILNREHGLAAAIFAGAAATDSIDGALARRLGAASQAGAYLDPVVDKIFLSMIFLALAAIGSVPWWFVGLVLGRDVLLLAACGLAIQFTRLRQFPPSVWGKLSTFLQIVCVVSVLSGNAWPDLAGGLGGRAVWLSAAGTLWSGLAYGWRGMGMWRESKHGTA